MVIAAENAHAHGTWSVGLCVCLSVRHHESCHYAQLSVQPKVPTASAQYGKYGKNALFKANKYVLTTTSYGADGERYF